MLLLNTNRKLDMGSPLASLYLTLDDLEGQMKVIYTLSKERELYIVGSTFIWM